MSNRKKGNYEKTLIIPVEKEMWQALRKISFEEETSMSQLARTALEDIINNHEKPID